VECLLDCSYMYDIHAKLQRYVSGKRELCVGGYSPEFIVRSADIIQQGRSEQKVGINRE
jgi:hypothetical protein